MKKIKSLFLPALIGCLMCISSFSLRAEIALSPLDYLLAMHQAHQQKQYELFYIRQRSDNVESFRYRHAYDHQRQYAQLLRLDHSPEEIIQRDRVISYIGYGFQPFSLRSNQILDNLPTLLYADFSALSPYYHFIDGGKTRIADRVARIIRIMSRDNFRYQYTVWIDEESHLLLQSETLDRNNQVLEQFRVIYQFVDDQLLYIVEPIVSMMLPPLLVTPTETEKKAIAWQPNWLPAGFVKVNQQNQTLANNNWKGERVESQLYSDGLSSFTIYVLTNKEVIFNDQFWKEGNLTIYIQTINDKDIVIIGEIPLITAKNIAQQIQFISPPNKEKPL